MEIGIVGLGNVGAHLLSSIATVEVVTKIRIWNRTSGKAEAAIADIGSFDPIAAHKIEMTELRSFNTCDIVVICVGDKLRKSDTAARLAEVNFEIMQEIVQVLKPKPEAVVIFTAPRPSQIADLIVREFDLQRSKVMGFGGDLSKNRIVYSQLRAEGYSTPSHVVGEHPFSLIPVLEDESSFEAIKQSTQNFLRRITELGGPARNLAAPRLLMDLVESVIYDRHNIHYVTGYYEPLRRFLTWPFVVGRSGLIKSIPLELGTQAETALKNYCNG